jgi:hypothetical protein
MAAKRSNGATGAKAATYLDRLPHEPPVNGHSRSAVAIVPAAGSKAFGKPTRLPGSVAMQAGSLRYA